MLVTAAMYTFWIPCAETSTLLSSAPSISVGLSWTVSSTSSVHL